MKIVFMGTPDFALYSLKKLVESPHEICAVFCQPDKPVGRNQKLQKPPVKEFADEQGIPVFQPESLKLDMVKNCIEALEPDLIAVVAYGKMLPKAILDYPRYGCINVHGSLLPKYRGSAPVHWAVMNGETKTGVTTMYMAEEMDAGDILLAKETPIGETEIAGDVYDRLAEMGADLLLETIEKLEAGALNPVPQDAAQVSFAPMLKKEMGKIDWTKTSEEIINLIRGLNPWPVAYTNTNKGILKIYRAEKEQIPSDLPPGTVIENPTSLIVKTGNGCISLKEVQLQGKRKMDIVDFIRGNTVSIVL
ncbi:MAG: methionyl-tRNA formyltransferase [Clostridia bacterium]|nr:methionyl-tRNA formyltransferase [Clostridia bacterium]